MESKSKSRSNAVAASNSRRRHYGLLLLFAVGAALLAVVLLHKMRERRVMSLLLKERDQQILSLEFLYKKEKANTKEMKRRLEDMKAKSTFLKSQTMELKEKLMNSESTAAYLKNRQKELEAALEEKENQIKQLEEKATEHNSEQVTALTGLLKQKEAEIEEMGQQLLKQELHTANATPQDEPPEETTAFGDERTLKEESHVTNANGTDNNQPEEEGTWVKLNTNLEEGSEVSGHDHLDKFELTQDNEKSFDDAKMGLIEVKEQSEEHKDEEITESSEDRKLSEHKNSGESDIFQGGEKRIIEDVSTDNGITELNNKEIEKVEGSTIISVNDSTNTFSEVVPTDGSMEITANDHESKHGSEDNQEELLSRKSEMPENNVHVDQINDTVKQETSTVSDSEHADA